MNDILFRKFCKIQDSVNPPYTKFCSSGMGLVFQDVRLKITCNDGFSFSCQASGDHYCSPKEYGLPAKDYKAWEIGYPSAHDHALIPFIEDDDRDSSDSIYLYVPTEVVLDLIEKHGGL